MKRTYPQLEIDLAVLRSNAQQVIRRCRAQNIRVCGVVKGVDGLPEVARALYHAADADVTVMTAADDVLGIAAQRGEVDLQLWISAIHANTSCIIIS